MNVISKIFQYLNFYSKANIQSVIWVFWRGSWPLKQLGPAPAAISRHQEIRKQRWVCVDQSGASIESIDQSQRRRRWREKSKSCPGTCSSFFILGNNSDTSSHSGNTTQIWATSVCKQIIWNEQNQSRQCNARSLCYSSFYQIKPPALCPCKNPLTPHLFMYVLCTHWSPSNLSCWTNANHLSSSTDTYTMSLKEKLSWLSLMMMKIKRCLEWRWTWQSLLKCLPQFGFNFWMTACTPWGQSLETRSPQYLLSLLGSSSANLFYASALFSKRLMKGLNLRRLGP